MSMPPRTKKRAKNPSETLEMSGRGIRETNAQKERETNNMQREFHGAKSGERNLEKGKQVMRKLNSNNLLGQRGTKVKHKKKRKGNPKNNRC